MSLYFDPDGQPMTLEEWSAMFARRSPDDSEWWRRHTDIEGTQVSTVWLGLDHQWDPAGPPLFWETMIFGGEHDEDCWRYSSREDAFSDHDRIVACLREGREP